MYEQGWYYRRRISARDDEQLTVLRRAPPSGDVRQRLLRRIRHHDVVTKMCRAEGDLEDNHQLAPPCSAQLAHRRFIVGGLPPDPAGARGGAGGHHQLDYPTCAIPTTAPCAHRSAVDNISPRGAAAAAAAVMDYHTGELVAIVGGREELQNCNFNRAYQNNTPVGSSTLAAGCPWPGFDLGNSSRARRHQPAHPHPQLAEPRTATRVNYGAHLPAARVRATLRTVRS